MKLYQQRWWEKLFHKKEDDSKVKSLKDIQAVIEFLNEVKHDVNALLPNLRKLEELEKERRMGHENIMHINLETQAEILDKVIQRYSSFQDDTDINGLRIKGVALQFLRYSDKAGLKDLVKEKKKNPQWKLQF